MRWFIGILFLIPMVISTLLFTAFGNSILQPLVELKIQANVPVDVKLEQFELHSSALKIKLVLASTSMIEAKGEYSLFSQSANIDYVVNIADLSILKAYTEQPLQGPFSTKGDIKGDMQTMTVRGSGTITKSHFEYDIALEGFNPKRIVVNADLKLQELLYLVVQPKFAKADINIHADMKNLDINSMVGDVATKVRSGMINSALLKRDFNITLPLTAFTIDANTEIKDSIATTASDVITTIAQLHTKKTVFDIKSGTFATDYKAIVDDLNNLYFITERKLKGALTVTGHVKQENGQLEATANSNVLGGDLNATAVDNKMTGTIKGFQTTALTDMLIMQRVFSSTMNADLNYDIATKKGVLNAELLRGKILPNKMSTMLQQMAKFDITKEIYEKTELTSKINDKIIISDLYMKSNLTDIKSINALVDLKSNLVDAKLDLIVKKYPIPITIKGDLNSPKIGIDVNKILQGQGKAKIKEAIDKKLGDKLPENAKNLLKKFF